MNSAAAAETSAADHAESVDVDLLMRLYREMCRGRALEARLQQLVNARVFRGFYHPGRGQEAVQAGACTAVRPDDYLFYAHRGITYLTAKGMDPTEILGDFRGLTSGSTRGLGAGIIHCIDPDHGILGQGGTLGSCFPLSAGAALAAVMRGEDKVALAFFGDGASARGTFLESAVTAVAWRLPVVWVCENNGWAVSAPLERVQGTSSVASRAEGCGMFTQTVDGQDVLAVYDVVSQAAEHARGGGGPAFVEAFTHRFDGHYTGDLQPYRDRDDVAATRQLDPVVAARARLESLGVHTDVLETVLSEVEAELDQADARAQAGSPPPPERVLEGLYA